MKNCCKSNRNWAEYCPLQLTVGTKIKSEIMSAVDMKMWNRKITKNVQCFLILVVSEIFKHITNSLLLVKCWLLCLQKFGRVDLFISALTQPWMIIIHVGSSTQMIKRFVLTTDWKKALNDFHHANLCLFVHLFTHLSYQDFFWGKKMCPSVYTFHFTSWDY